MHDTGYLTENFSLELQLTRCCVDLIFLKHGVTLDLYFQQQSRPLSPPLHPMTNITLIQE